MAITKIISSIFGKYPIKGIKNQNILYPFVNEKKSCFKTSST
tara:strand:+ start:429 stop:554 length:126 start_codon:yes stop_codon:yes gene_type:complete